MLKRIIVVTDLSQNSNALVNCLGGLKAYGTEKCLLLQCMGIPDSPSVARSYSVSILEGMLESQKRTLEQFGYDVELRIISGSVKNEINKIAVDEGYSAIVVGSQKNSMISEIFYTGVAYDVLHHAETPILLIRLEDQAKEGQCCVKATGFGSGQHILFPTDFSDNAEIAFEYVVEIAAKYATKITLLHVQDKSRIGSLSQSEIDEKNRIDNNRLQRMKNILLEKGESNIDTVIKFGSPSIEIIKLVDERNVQLVIMGSQGRGFTRELFLGSVSHNVTRMSSSSVLLVPMKRD